MAYGLVAVSERVSSAGVQQWRPVLCKAGGRRAEKKTMMAWLHIKRERLLDEHEDELDDARATAS
jgi:hypothetical protein